MSTTHRALRRLCALSAGLLSFGIAVPMPAAAQSGPALTCDTAFATEADRLGCRQTGATLDALMAAALPAQRAELEAELAEGITVNGVTLRCALGVSCDTAPVALAGLTARYGDRFVGMSDPIGREAMYDALSAPITVRAAEALTTVLARVLATEPAARVEELQRAAADALTSIRQCASCADAEPVFRDVLGLVMLTYVIPPSAPEPPARTDGVGSVSYTATNVLDGALTGNTRWCNATWRYGKWLEVDKEAFSDKLVIRTGFTIYGIRWMSPQMEGVCTPPELSLTAAYQATATSNGGGFASRTKNAPFASGRGTLTLPDYGFNAGAMQEWETDAVEWDYAFPFGAEVHFFAEPAGNYRWDGAGTISVNEPYRFSGGYSAVDLKGFCDKRGSAEASCSMWVP